MLSANDWYIQWQKQWKTTNLYIVHWMRFIGLPFSTSCHIFYLNKWTNECEYSPIETIVINSNFECDPRNLLSDHSNNSVFHSMFISKFFLSFILYFVSKFKSTSNNFKNVCEIYGKKTLCAIYIRPRSYIYDLVGKIERQNWHQ